MEKTTEMFCKREPSHKGGDFFTAFYPNAFCVHLHDPDAVILRVQVAEDTTTDRHDTYWGWWDSAKARYDFVHAHRMLLDMCFPAGIRGEEEWRPGSGQATPVTVTVLEEGVACH